MNHRSLSGSTPVAGNRTGSLRACLGIICCGISLAGCQPAAPPAPPGPATGDHGAGKQAAPKPYLAGWETPAAALVLTGEVHGYLEPCGCSLMQSGGLARRASLLAELDKKKWPYAGLDAGGTLKKANRQDQIKFEALVGGLQELRYSGLALGVEELLLTPEVLMSQHLTDDPRAVSFLCANLVFFDSPEIGTPRPWKILQVGDVKIGVTAVLGASHKNDVAPAGVTTNVTFIDPLTALPGVIKAMQAEKPDFLVLLSHGTAEEAKSLAESFPPFRLILTAGGPDEASGKPIVVKETWILETGTKGRSIGVVGYYPQNQDQPFRFELVELDSQRFAGEDSMTVVMRNYQQRLQDERISESDSLKIPHPSGWAFVGTETCGECHAKSYEHWKTTGHAKATETLLHGRGTEREWVPRQFDPECLSCHVTGWEPQKMLRYDTGYFSLEASKHLLGQQCENCHGPGSQHVEVERAFRADAVSVPRIEVDDLRAALRLSVKTAEKTVCIQCHDAENSPGFKFEDAWEEVKHPWKD